MTGESIRIRIDSLRKEIRDSFNPTVFTFDKNIHDNLLEIDKLQNMCPHKFENGMCVYCDLMEANRNG